MKTQATVEKAAIAYNNNISLIANEIYIQLRQFCEIYCPTPQLEKAVREKLHALGYKWSGGDSLIGKSFWEADNDFSLCISKDGITYGPVTPSEHRKDFYSVYSAVDFLYHMIHFSLKYKTISGYPARLSFAIDETIYGWIEIDRDTFIPAEWIEYSGRLWRTHPITLDAWYDEIGSLDLIEVMEN
ncbi:hypothetical protein [Dyadobacter sp. CY312]|uniref:hypothetical protein n=1 Tax=Dyadobacter sp. CY312 TaxID=2907303 RepID=UPI001F3E221E|nr:hypothetical protein [Dyadobacter sp. CY312]MCE7039741.1 hypothetical protein [Dyadobacter sp. CY312]